MGTTSDQFVEALSERGRVLLIGGLAIIAHGLSRPTEDADLWLDSMLPMEDWISLLKAGAAEEPESYFWDLSRRERVADPRRTIEEIGVIRIGGLDRYVDVFRRPNELAEEDFDAAWEISPVHVGKIRLLDESFLIATKLDTGRESDLQDVYYLEVHLRTKLAPRLAICPLAEAEEAFARYADHATCLAALKNPDPAVRALGLSVLRELAASNNPFAIEALKAIDN